MYVCAVCFVQSMVDAAKDDTVENLKATNPRLLEFWGDVFQGMLTLFMTITGGVNWYDCVMPLEKVSHATLYMFLAFIFVTYFCVLNVVTGVFCNSAIEAAGDDPDLQAFHISQQHKTTRSKIKEFFHKMDTDGSGMVSVLEFEQALSDEEMLSNFEAIGVGVSEAWEVFQLLDSDHSNTVDGDEFIEGCLKLHGGSSEVDVALIRADINQILKAVDQMWEWQQARQTLAEGSGRGGDTRTF
eukprot:TRINITY_DN68756_c0_g1_i1.p1 TRINITY_DN68756_c0_g1~~TRINITY_DN68756_c0_g1_i1.p1  ORF type:complete len:270 (+),score=53.27 TRINITY_DN68756_c0_g1_i1:87-812(+)